MWEPALFAVLTAYVVWHAGKRGDRAALSCALILMAVWIACMTTAIITSLALATQDAYRVQGETGAAMDVAAGVAVVTVWVATGRVWPLLVMVLFFLQVATHRWQADGADTFRARLVTWLLLDVFNLAQLACTRFGPDAHQAVGVLRRLSSRFRSRRGGAVSVRKTAP